jgi:glycine/D-amino acid oxidase-like deaminating enzyme
VSEIERVGVIGAGLMGHGIAQVAAQAGYDVVVRDVDEATLTEGIGRISTQLGRAVEEGTFDQPTADVVRGRIHGTVAYEDLADCDLVVEAITEDLGLKLVWGWSRADGSAETGPNAGRPSPGPDAREQVMRRAIGTCPPRARRRSTPGTSCPTRDSLVNPTWLTAHPAPRAGRPELA